MFMFVFFSLFFFFFFKQKTAYEMRISDWSSDVCSSDLLEQSAEKAARMPSFENSFRNLYLNQRVNMVSAFVSPAVWKSGNVPIDDEAFLAGPIYGGLDLSATTDLTALVMTARDHEGVLHVRPYFWMPQDSV